MSDDKVVHIGQRHDGAKETTDEDRRQYVIQMLEGALEQAKVEKIIAASIILISSDGEVTDGSYWGKSYFVLMGALEHIKNTIYVACRGLVDRDDVGL